MEEFLVKNKFIFILLIFFNIFSCLNYANNKIILTDRQLSDLELILNGGFNPLDGFLSKDDYYSVLYNMRLANGNLWPMPIVLDVDRDFVNKIKVGEIIELYSKDLQLLALMQISDIWQPDKFEEAQLVYGTTNLEHPGVYYLFKNTKEFYLGGKVKKIEMPFHYDFIEYRKSPNDLKNYFKEKGYKKIVAFQTRNPMHRAHQEITQRIAKSMDAHLLIHPAVGPTKPGDIDHFTRVKCYKNILKYYPENSVTLSLLPIAMRMAGPREALWHAIIRKNYGCTHFIIGRDHAGPGKDSSGKDFYDPYQAQELVMKYASEIGIEIVLFKEIVYVPEQDCYKTLDEITKDTKFLQISGTQLRNLLKNGSDIPSWFSYKEVIEELRKIYPEKAKQGLTLFFTGLSGSGKTTLANALAIKLSELQSKKISILDGDLVRPILSQELGFSKEHRSLNVRRVGFVANEITKHGGIAIVTLIAPYKEDRDYVRNLIKSSGNYIEIYLSTPLKVCQERDVKGLYQQAQAGIITNFTGISDPYEIPENPELTIDTSNIRISQALDIIINYLRYNNYI